MTEKDTTIYVRVHRCAICGDPVIYLNNQISCLCGTVKISPENAQLDGGLWIELDGGPE